MNGSPRKTGLKQWLRSKFGLLGVSKSEPERVRRTSGGVLAPTIEELRGLSSLDAEPLNLVDRRTNTGNLFDEPLDSDDESYNEWWFRTQVRQR